jgi:hypothetical protein
MARFEMSLLMALMECNEITTIEHEIICFCNDSSDPEEIHEKANEIIKEMINDHESEDSEVLFGSAIIELDNTTLSLQFMNKNKDRDEMYKLMDLILDTDEETMH